jgi:hypothetical protein
MSKVYISGPMTGMPGFNYAAFNELAAELRERGYVVLNPAENFGGETDRPRADYMRLDIQHVLDADEVIVLDGWEGSRGAALEVKVALEVGIPVYDMRGDIVVDAPVIPKPVVQGYEVPRERGLYRVTQEVRITDPRTGGQKGKKLAELGALDPHALLTVAEVAGFGSRKYARMNYLRGYDWSLSFDAMQRHLLQFWDGQDVDAESGLPHVAHAAWHALALLAFMQRGLGTDDRYKGSENG